MECSCTSELLFLGVGICWCCANCDRGRASLAADGVVQSALLALEPREETPAQYVSAVVL